MIGKSVCAARCGDMKLEFDIPLTLIGVDEYNVYLIDCSHDIQGWPYVRSFTKEWIFKHAVSGHWFGFEYASY